MTEIQTLDDRVEHMRHEHETADQQPILTADNVFPPAPVTLEFEAYSWVIDQFVYEGTFLFTGSQGLGKTTCLVPLALAATGLIQFPGITVSTPRQVVYVTEDVFQVNQILSALAEEHKFTAEDLDEVFHVRQSKNKSASDIAAHFAPYVKTLKRQVLTPAGKFMIPALTVLDTFSASIKMENENDNAEGAKNIAILRGAFDDVLWLTGHTPKSTSSYDAKNQTTRGASSFEANTQGTFYLADTGTNDRFLQSGKRRDQGKLRAIALRIELKQRQSTNKYGLTDEQDYVVPYLSPGVEATVQASARTNKQMKIENAIIAEIQNMKCATKNKVLNAVVDHFGKDQKGNNVVGTNSVNDAFKELDLQGKIKSFRPPKEAKLQGATECWLVPD